MDRTFNVIQNIVYSCRYHVVWCPKYKRSVLVDGVEVRLREILQAVAEEKQARLLQLEIQSDRVYLLVECDPHFGIAKLIRLMKARSSRDLRQEFRWLRSRLPTLWNSSMFIATAGGMPSKAMEHYIQNQRYL